MPCGEGATCLSTDDPTAPYVCQCPDGVSGPTCRRGRGALLPGGLSSMEVVYIVCE